MGHRKEKKEERAPDPILNLRHARLRAVKVMEKEAAEKDGKSFAPKVSIWWEILDDKAWTIRPVAATTARASGITTASSSLLRTKTPTLSVRARV